MQRLPITIVVLDGYTLTHGDLSWEALQPYGECHIYERSTPAEIVPRSITANIVLTNKAVLSEDVIRRLPQLEYIGITATGANIVDLAAARGRGIIVTNVPGYGSDSVAQHVFAHVLNLARRVGDLSTAVRAGRWAQSPDFCFWDAPMVELRGLTMGIIGFGEIGRAAAKIAAGFDMQVIAHTRSAVTHPDYVQIVDADTVFRESDVVSLHCPLTPETERLVNRARLRQMKPSAWLINTARGQLVDEEALAAALVNGDIAGAGLDVLSVEPPPAEHPLYEIANCYITPHIAWATFSSRKRLMDIVVENVAAFLAGKPQNVVS